MQKFLILLFCIFPFISCTRPPKMYRFEKQVMGMRLHLKVPSKKGVAECVNKVFKEIDEIYNNWNPNSEISRLNDFSSADPFPVSEKLYEFLKKVDSLVNLTEGRFDPTVSPLVKQWKESLEKGSLLTEERKKYFLKECGWHYLSFNAGCVIKHKSGIQIDLCGVSKGYAVDLLTQKLKELGCPWAYVEWGGEVKTLGCHPSGRDWNISVEGMHQLKVENAALATSGGFWHCWTVEGKNYTHIIHPHTGDPVELKDYSPYTCAVKCTSCMEADAIATALMCFSSTDEASNWATDHLKNHTVYLVDQKTWRQAHHHINDKACL